MICTVTLNPSTDICVRVKKFSPSLVIRSKKTFHYPGGKGLNAARAAAALGQKPAAAGFCGRKNLEPARKFLENSGVEAHFVPAPGENRFCLLINTGRGETVINSEALFKITRLQKEALLGKLARLSGKCGIFIISGSMPLCLEPSFYGLCVKAAKGNSTVILDASSKNLREGIKARPHIIKQNISELGSAFGVNLSSAGKIRRLSAKLTVKYGLLAVIATDGKNGSYLFEKGALRHIKPFRSASALSPAGCGDAYSAGLACGIEKGLGLMDSCVLGSACAAANLENEGACFFSRDRVKNILKHSFPEISRLL